MDCRPVRFSIGNACRRRRTVAESGRRDLQRRRFTRFRMKSFKYPNSVPPGGGWFWTHPETKDRIRGGNAEQLVFNSKEYCRRNHLPIGAGFDQRIVDDVCAELPDICQDTEPPSAIDMARQFTRSALNWVRSGLPCVTNEQFQERLDTCKACDKWNGEAVFGLGRCGKCGCTGVKLFMTTEKCPLNKWPKL